MSLRIMQNIDALNAYRNLSVTQGQMSKSLEKLSSGYRINRAADDAAGLAISEGLRSQIGGLKVAVRNAQDGVSVVQTAEGALTEVHSILQRVRDLSVQAANEGSNNLASEGAIASEMSELGSALTDIASRTEFNGTKLLDGSTASLTFQVGANAGDTVTVNLADISAVGTAVSTLATSISGAASVTTAATAASGGITTVDGQISAVSTARAGPRRLAEPLRAHHQLPERRRGEPVGVGEPDPGHRHGPGDDELHPLADPLPGRHRDAGSGERCAAGCAEAPAVTHSGS